VRALSLRIRIYVGFPVDDQNDPLILSHGRISSAGEETWRACSPEWDLGHHPGYERRELGQSECAQCGRRHLYWVRPAYIGFVINDNLQLLQQFGRTLDYCPSSGFLGQQAA